MLPNPKTTGWVFLTDAVYGSDGRPVCGTCWSRLSPTWGRGYGGDESYSGFEQYNGRDEAPYVDKDGDTWLVWKDAYRCGNPDCDGGAIVRTIPAWLGTRPPYHPGDVKANTLKDPLYKKGFYDDDGIFFIEENGQFYNIDTSETSGLSLAVKIKGPWVYIDTGTLAKDMVKEIPDSWTREKRFIKANRKSARFKQIEKWFAQRGVRLDLPEPEEK